jgi:hypothetical protein
MNCSENGLQEAIIIKMLTSSLRVLKILTLKMSSYYPVENACREYIKLSFLRNFLQRRLHRGQLFATFDCMLVEYQLLL